MTILPPSIVDGVVRGGGGDAVRRDLPHQRPPPPILLLSARGCAWSGPDEQTEYTAINAKVLKLFENFGKIHNDVSVQIFH